MALIKCSECGHMISDKAMKCPKCGCPVTRRPAEATPSPTPTAKKQPTAQLQQAAQPQSATQRRPTRAETPKREAPQRTRAGQERNTSGLTVALWTVVLLMVAACVGILCWKLFFAKDEAEIADTLDTVSSSSVSEDASGVEYDDYCAVDTMPAEESIDRAEVVRNAYLGKVREMKEQFTARGEYNEWDCWYFLLDITHDGTPELWINTGALEANSMDKGFCVYTYGDKCLRNLGKDWWGNHSCFYAGSDYVIRVNAHMDDAEWTKYSYSGKKLKIEQIYEEHISADEDYREPKEKYIERTSWDDTAPIERMPVN